MTLIAERIPDDFRGRAVVFGNIGWPLGNDLRLLPLPGPRNERATFACEPLPRPAGILDPRLYTRVGTVEDRPQGGAGARAAPPHATGHLR